MRRYTLPLLIITTILVLLNWFIYSMAALSFSTPPTWLVVTVTLGVVLMPGSMLITMTPFREKLRLVTLAGYVWMGVFTLAFFFAFVQLAFTLL